MAVHRHHRTIINNCIISMTGSSSSNNIRVIIKVGSIDNQAMMDYPIIIMIVRITSSNNNMVVHHHLFRVAHRHHHILTIARPALAAAAQPSEVAGTTQPVQCTWSLCGVALRCIAGVAVVNAAFIHYGIHWLIFHLILSPSEVNNIWS